MLNGGTNKFSLGSAALMRRTESFPEFKPKTSRARESHTQLRIVQLDTQHMRIFNLFQKRERATPAPTPTTEGALARENWVGDRVERSGHFGAQSAAIALGGITVVTGCVATDGAVAANDANYNTGRTLLLNGERVHVRLAPAAATQQQKYEHYQRIILASGGKMSPSGATVLGLRGLDPGGRVHETRARGDLQDTFVVLRKNAAGQASVREFRGSTYPGQRASRISPDVNRDRAGDVGMIAEGHFSVVSNGPFHGKPSYHIRTVGGSGYLPGVRDTNHDGIHSAAEWSASKARGDRLSEVLFHRTGSSGGVSSIGCLNVADIDGFASAVGGTGARFNFTLVNALAKEAR